MCRRFDQQILLLFSSGLASFLVLYYKFGLKLCKLDHWTLLVDSRGALLFPIRFPHRGAFGEPTLLGTRLRASELIGATNFGTSVKKLGH